MTAAAGDRRPFARGYWKRRLRMPLSPSTMETATRMTIRIAVVGSTGGKKQGVPSLRR
jgi:hypothetical protein